MTCAVWSLLLLGVTAMEPGALAKSLDFMSSSQSSRSSSSGVQPLHKVVEKYYLFGKFFISDDKNKHSNRNSPHSVEAAVAQMAFQGITECLQKEFVQILMDVNIFRPIGYEWWAELSRKSLPFSSFRFPFPSVPFPALDRSPPALVVSHASTDYDKTASFLAFPNEKRFHQTACNILLSNYPDSLIVYIVKLTPDGGSFSLGFPHWVVPAVNYFWFLRSSYGNFILRSRSDAAQEVHSSSVWVAYVFGRAGWLPWLAQASLDSLYFLFPPSFDFPPIMDHAGQLNVWALVGFFLLAGFHVQQIWAGDFHFSRSVVKFLSELFSKTIHQPSFHYTLWSPPHPMICRVSWLGTFQANTVRVPPWLLRWPETYRAVQHTQRRSGIVEVMGTAVTRDAVSQFLPNFQLLLLVCEPQSWGKFFQDLSARGVSYGDIVQAWTKLSLDP